MRRFSYIILIALLMIIGAAWGIARIEDGSCRALILNGQYDHALDSCKSMAKQGSAVAQFDLGWMYDYGKGVAQDYKKAARWYRQSAEQGHIPAQYNLGWLYKLGDGVRQNNSQAYFWWGLAAIQGDAISAKNQKLLVEHMSAKELEQAQALLSQGRQG